MACPTCDHTMQHVAADGLADVFWCPRCGTLKKEVGGEPRDTEAPKLVERTRIFEAELHCKSYEERPDGIPALRNQWRIEGCAESINTPEKRPS